MALPYQIWFNGCLYKARIDYRYGKYEHPGLLQWIQAMGENDEFKQAGITGLLGSGFVLGVTNVCAYAVNYW